MLLHMGLYMDHDHGQQCLHTAERWRHSSALSCPVALHAVRAHPRALLRCPICKKSDGSGCARRYSFSRADYADTYMHLAKKILVCNRPAVSPRPMRQRPFLGAPRRSSACCLHVDVPGQADRPGPWRRAHWHGCSISQYRDGHDGSTGVPPATSPPHTCVRNDPCQLAGRC